MSQATPKSCVIGWPISHSRSPIIHTYWLKTFGLAGSYERVPVEPDALQRFFQSLRNGAYVGCNVTLPHKQSALAFVDEPDDRVRRIGALNTVWREQQRLCATSTDGPGYVANLRQHCAGFSIEGSRIVILGAGGSARAIVDELLREKAERISIFNRTPARAQELATLFGAKTEVADAHDLPKHLASTDLLINTTSAGIDDHSQLDLPWQSLNKASLVSDISYVPLVTPFLRDAKSRGHKTITGLGMLLHQAVFGFERWFGHRPTVTPELYSLVARDIDPEFQP